MSGTKPTTPSNMIAREFRGVRLYLVSVHAGRGMRWLADQSKALKLTMPEALVLSERASREWGTKCAVLDALGNLAQRDTMVVTERARAEAKAALLDGCVLPVSASRAKTYCHPCPDWDFMVIDRNSAELVGCSCFDDPEFLAVREQHSQALDRVNETL